MARFSTKNQTPAELKTLLKELGASLKALKGSQALATKADADAVKVFEAASKEAGKVLAAATKAHDAAVKAAQKVLDAHNKTGEKEAKKLSVQVSAHEEKIAQVTAALNPATEPAAA